MNFPPFIYKIPHPFLLFLDIKKDPKAFLVLSVIRVCRLRPLSVYPAGRPASLSGGVFSVSTAADKKRGCF